jgi:hypothetical protein
MVDTAEAFTAPWPWAPRLFFDIGVFLVVLGTISNPVVEARGALTWRSFWQYLTGAMVAGSIFLMLSKNLVRFIFGLVLASNAVNLLIFAAGRLENIQATA